jgi:hypothetical protein
MISIERLLEDEQGLIMGEMMMVKLRQPMSLPSVLALTPQVFGRVN